MPGAIVAIVNFEEMATCSKFGLLTHSFIVLQTLTIIIDSQCNSMLPSSYYREKHASNIIRSHCVVTSKKNFLRA